jgi:hypothetical protein
MIDAKANGMLIRRARSIPDVNRPAWAHALMGDLTWNPRAADDIRRRTTAGVLEGIGRAGLVNIPPLPFLPSC